MQQLILTKGLPGSGKTTWARQWVEESPKTRVRINRDDIRRMLGPYWIPSREDLVTEIERRSAHRALLEGYDVVIDATNFKAQGLLDFIDRESSGYEKLYELQEKSFMDVPIAKCIEQDAKRPNGERVGPDVIKAMADRYGV